MRTNFEDHYQQIDAIHSGEVIDIYMQEDDITVPDSLIYTGDMYTIAFKVSKLWKGTFKDTILIKSSLFSVSCGINWQLNQSYIVYSYLNSNSVLATNMCTRTGLAGSFHSDIIKLGPGMTSESANSTENTIISEYYETGNIFREGLYIDGKIEGEINEYWENGSSKFQWNYKDGLTEGLSRSYYDTDTLAGQFNYSGGMYHGQQLYYNQNGILTESFNYLIGEKEGEQIRYYDNQQISSFINYSNGVKNGPILEYYLDGSLRVEGNYVDGKIHGDYTRYYADGTVNLDQYYNMGAHSGEQFSYYPDGSLKSHSLNNPDSVKFFSFYESGAKEVEAYYLSGDPYDTPISRFEYYENGNFKYTVVYSGDSVTTRFFFEDGPIRTERLSINGAQIYIKDYDEFGNLIRLNYVSDINRKNDKSEKEDWLSSSRNSSKPERLPISGGRLVNRLPFSDNILNAERFPISGGRLVS